MKVLKILVVCVLVVALLCAAVALTPLKTQVLKLFYPLRYTAIVTREAERWQLDPNLIYAVIRTESGFDPNARSHAGAKGLMQLTDGTFAWMQELLGEEGQYDSEDLYEPEVNIRYGCAFLSRLIEYYDNLETALCAYNAGMGNVAAWLEDPDRSPDGETLTRIPFPETEQYVKKVIRSRNAYRELYRDPSGA